MNWIKVISINILVVFTLIIVLELLSGLGRVLIGKDFRLPLTALIGKILITQLIRVMKCERMFF